MFGTARVPSVGRMNRMGALLKSATIDPTAGYALFLPFSAANPTYRVGATTYSPHTALPGYADTRSGGKGEVEATDRAGSYGPEVLTNGEFTANVASWTPANLTATWTAGAALLTKTLDGNSFAQTVTNALTFGRWRLVARLVVSERARIQTAGSFANLDGNALWVTSTPGTYDIDLTLTSLGATGNAEVSVVISDNAVWAANGATVSVEYIRLTKIASRIDYLGTNQPAIVPGVGYWSRGALTNLEVQSQTFGSRTLTTATVASNDTVAPDGTTTADTLTATAVMANASVNLTIVASTLYTTSVFIPAGGTGLFAYIQINAGVAGASGSAFITFNRSTGAISAVQTITAGIVGLTGYAVAIGTGWRFVATWTGPAAITNADTLVGLSETTATRVTVIGKTMPAWQGQTIIGNHPAGGPIIPTVAATGATGEDLLAATNVTLTNNDQLIWAVVPEILDVSSNRALAWLGDATDANTVILRHSGGQPWVQIIVAGVTQWSNFGGAPVLGATLAVFAHKSGANVRGGWVQNGVVNWIAAASAGNLPTVPLVTAVGNNRLVGGVFNGPVKGVYAKEGSFANDAAILAAITAVF